MLESHIFRPLPDLMEQGHRDPPMRHRARRILFCDLSELLPCLFVSKGMQQRYSALKGGLRSRLARNRKRNLPEFLVRVVMMPMHLVIKPEPRQSADSPDQHTAKQFHADHLPQAQILNSNQLSKFSPQGVRIVWSENRSRVRRASHAGVKRGSSADCASLAPLRIKIPFDCFALEVQFVTPASARSLFVLLEH